MRATLAAILILGLTSCAGSGFQSKQASEEKTFADDNSQTGYNVLVEKPKFLNSLPDVSKESRLASDAALANGIKNVRLDMDDADPTRLNLKVTFAKAAPLELSTPIQVRGKLTYSFNGVSKDGRFQVSGNCAENFCEHASFIFRESQSGRYVYVDYSRTLEFLKPADLERIAPKNKDDRELLDDVIEYHLPITRHAAKISGRSAGTSVIDLLIVARPAVDAQEDAEEDDEQDGLVAPSVPAQPTQPGQPKPTATAKPDPVKPARNEEHTIELEAVGDDESADEGEKPDAATEKPEGSGATPKPSSSATLSLTSNPYEVYKIKIPKERLRGLDVQYPSALPATFDIIPAQNQRLGEPVHRMALIAEAFVESEVKIYRNACNIYVRAVMMLAGYTKGETPLANQFARLFQTRGQGLNEWERPTFKNNGSQVSQTVNQNGLQTLLKEIPNGYATVAQWVRAGGKHGHVGILARLDNRVYFMDGTLNNTKRGLRKSEVTTVKSLTNSSGRSDLTVYGIKGVIKRRSI